MNDKDSHVVSTKSEVVITDIKMPFISMVIFMVKWAIAAIPAIIILSVLFAMVTGFFGSITMTSHRM